MNNISNKLTNISLPTLKGSQSLRKTLLAVTGFSAAMVAKNEIGKHEVKKLIALKKERLAMVKINF